MKVLLYRLYFLPKAVLLFRGDFLLWESCMEAIQNLRLEPLIQRGLILWMEGIENPVLPPVRTPIGENFAIV